MNIAIGGEMTGAYDKVNKKTLIKLLKKKFPRKNS